MSQGWRKFFWTGAFVGLAATVVGDFTLAPLAFMLAAMTVCAGSAAVIVCDTLSKLSGPQA